MAPETWLRECFIVGVIVFLVDAGPAPRCYHCSPNHPYPECLNWPIICSNDEVCKYDLKPFVSLEMKCVHKDDCEERLSLGDLTICCPDDLCFNLAAGPGTSSTPSETECLGDCDRNHISSCRTHYCGSKQFCQLTGDAHKIRGECLDKEPGWQHCLDRTRENHFQCQNNPVLHSTKEPCIHCCNSSSCLQDLIFPHTTTQSTTKLITTRPTTHTTTRRSTHTSRATTPKPTYTTKPTTVSPVPTTPLVTPPAVSITPTAIHTIAASISCVDKVMNNGCSKLQSHNICQDRISLDICPVACGHCPLLEQLECKDILIGDECMIKASTLDFCSDAFAGDVCPKACNLCDKKKQEILNAAFPSTTARVTKTPASTHDPGTAAGHTQMHLTTSWSSHTPAHSKDVIHSRSTYLTVTAKRNPLSQQSTDVATKRTSSAFTSHALLQTRPTASHDSLHNLTVPGMSVVVSRAAVHSSIKPTLNSPTVAHESGSIFSNTPVTNDSLENIKATTRNAQPNTPGKQNSLPTASTPRVVTNNIQGEATKHNAGEVTDYVHSSEKTKLGTAVPAFSHTFAHAAGTVGGLLTTLSSLPVDCVDTIIDMECARMSDVCTSPVAHVICRKFCRFCDAS